jgi:hypothetical protein
MVAKIVSFLAIGADEIVNSTLHLLGSDPFHSALSLETNGTLFWANAYMALLGYVSHCAQNTQGLLSLFCNPLCCVDHRSTVVRK